MNILKMPEQPQKLKEPQETELSPEDNVVHSDRRIARERRLHPRYPFTATAEVAELPSGSVTKARTSDLSATGCFVDTASPSPMGAAVRLRLTKENRAFETKATVAYSKVGQGMGLLFTDFKAEQRAILDRWMGEISGELTPEPDAWDQTEQAPAAQSIGQEGNLVLNELIIVLMRKNVLTAVEEKAMLLNLLH